MKTALHSLVLLAPAQKSTFLAVIPITTRIPHLRDCAFGKQLVTFLLYLQGVE